MHDPKLSHWTIVKRIPIDLKFSINHGFLFSIHFDFIVHAYSNADWVGCLNDCRSTRGFCTILGMHLISLSSHK